MISNLLGNAWDAGVLRPGYGRRIDLELEGQLCTDGVCTLRHSMPSIFSRSRTQSTKGISSPKDTPDELGRVSSRTSAFGLALTISGKKDKKKDKDKRQRTLSSPNDRGPAPLPAVPDLPDLPEDVFLPFGITEPELEPDAENKDLDYGYLGYEKHVVLGLDEVARLVSVLSEELAARGPYLCASTSPARR